jgi:hypothetical protein
MIELDVTTVLERLGLGDEYKKWLEDLAAVGAPARPSRLPSASEMPAILERMGVATEDVTEIMAGLPDVRRDPAFVWLLERCHHRLTRDIGRVHAEVGEWRDLPGVLGSAGRYFYAYVFLAALGAARSWHRQSGIPDEVSWATLADFGRQMVLYRRMYGRGGLDTQWWLVRHWRGALYELGRLQFGPYRIADGSDSSELWYEDDEAAHMGLGFRRGDPAIGVHIPETGPLDPAACDHSFLWASDFFRRHFPEQSFRIATCISWLLDDQLRDYLDEESNLVRFQRRFQLVPGAVENDDEVFKFVFKVAAPKTTGVPQTTTLERAIVAHLRAGRHWRVRTGWVEL